MNTATSFLATRTGLALAAAALATACSDPSSHDSSQMGVSGGGTHAASASSQPATVLGPQSPLFRSFLADPNQRGVAASLHLVEARWGRLVQVFDLDAASQQRRLVHRDFLVGATVASDGVDYELTENLAGQAELTILHRQGSSSFHSALVAAENASVAITDAAQAPWSLVPRNAAISLRFDDLLDEATVDATTVRLRVGSQLDTPFEARILADRNHGSVADPDADGVFEFYTTRVIADLSVSELEATNSSQVLAINSLGLPASNNVQVAGAQLRLPSAVFPPLGQLIVLANPVGNGLDLAGNGSVDLGSPTRDVFRSFRAGGPTAVTGDPFNGFLEDVDPPRLVAELSLAITGAVQADPQVQDGYRLASVTFNNAACSAQPQVGDLLRQGGTTAVVYGGGTLNGTLLTGLELRVLAGGPPSGGLATLWTAFAPSTSNEQCFAHYLPLPILAPNRGVSPAARVHLRFSEPMDVASIDPFDSFTVSSTSATPGALDSIVGLIQAAADLTGFDFVPAMPLPHQAGSSEFYHVRVGTHVSPTDLAGNSLWAPLAVAQFQLDPSAASELSGNLALRFDSSDMIGSDGLVEFRGQFGFDTSNERIEPRPLVHFSADADRNQSVPAVMTPFPAGVQTPLVPLGAKLQNVWRYADLGFALLDEANTNVDVEGLSWAPIGGQLVADLYDEFSIQLGHASVLPDEVLHPNTLFPRYPLSGLEPTYAQNYADTPKLVHERSLGYLVNPADLFLAASGTPMLPFPLNRGVAPEERAYFTWRDTAMLALGGVSGSGAPFDQEILVGGLPNTKVYQAGQVPSVGLPLLMEYRCYLDFQALGTNAFDISLAANTSARPNFRAFSAGGYNSVGNPIAKNPDNEQVASGGFNPSNGQSTPGVDNSFYIGSVDLVTRVSRAHTIWFDSGTQTASFGAPSVASSLPNGTEVKLAYRGATAIQGGNPGGPLYIGSDAQALDMYGDPLDASSMGVPLFLNGDPSWFDDMAQLDGARFVQVRVTFVGNAVSGATATLNGLGLAWTD